VDIEVTIYRGTESRFFGDYELAPILRRAALRHFGEVARRGQIELHLEKSVDEHAFPGPPQVRNITKKFARCSLRLIQDGRAVNEDRLPIVDLLGPVLADELRGLQPEETSWAFALRPRQLAVIPLGSQFTMQLPADERPAPEAQGAVEVDPGEPRHRPFTLTPLAGAEAELVQPELLGLDPEELGKINVLVPARIHDQLLHDTPLSNRMEEGGFLLGRVTKAADEVHLVEITHVTRAHRTGAGAVHFTFTGNSFLAAVQLIEERGRNEQLVGWYHTHLLSDGVDMGLSTVDVDLHLATFQRPWQVAALINVQHEGRVLRFYGRDQNALREYDQWISDDSGKYRPAGRALGGG